MRFIFALMAFTVALLGVMWFCEGCMEGKPSSLKIEVNNKLMKIKIGTYQHRHNRFYYMAMVTPA